MLMPADPREWLPAGHLAWKVIELAGEMDLSGFGASYRGDLPRTHPTVTCCYAVHDEDTGQRRAVRASHHDGDFEVFPGRPDL
jgi:hypothetical protein